MRLSQDTRRNARGLRVAVMLLAVAAACSASDAHSEAVAVLVDRGMEPEVAECAVQRLEQRGGDVETVGDGLVDPSEHPEVVEAVAACAVVLAGDGAEAGDGG